MIVGISGKAQSGKDLVGKIIQYLTREVKAWQDWTINKDISNILSEWGNTLNRTSSWDIKRFGDLPKVIAGQILGIDDFVEQWEENKNGFRDKELGKEWDKIINPIDSFGVIMKDVELIQHLTHRTFLQQLATNSAREIHPNVWVNSLMNEYKDIDNDRFSNIPLACGTIYPNWIITDVRFPNEVKTIEDRDGFVIRVERDMVQLNEYKSGKKEVVPIEYHPSETALDNHKFKYTIDNNGTIEELIEKVKVILVKEELI